MVFTLEIERDDIQGDILEYLSETCNPTTFYLDSFLERKVTDGGVKYKELFFNRISKEPMTFESIGFKFGIHEEETKYQLPTGEDFTIVFKNTGQPLCVDGDTIFHKVLKIGAESKEILQKIIFNAFIFSNEKKEAEKICIFNRNGPRWQKISSAPKRETATVFHSKKDEIIADLDKFLQEEDIHLANGIVYKKNYLLHGPPGCGKTSFIQSIASRYNFSLYYFPIDDKISDATLKSLVSSIPEGSIVSFEDFDYVLDSNINMSTLLTLLDGFGRKSKVIFFLTTNFLEKFKPILTRPGRIDKLIEFPYISEQVFNDMFKFFRPNEDEQVCASIYKEYIGSKELTPCIMHKFLFDKRDEKNLLSKDCKKYFQQLLVEHNQIKSSSSMYL